MARAAVLAGRTLVRRRHQRAVDRRSWSITGLIIGFSFHTSSCDVARRRRAAAAVRLRLLLGLRAASGCSSSSPEAANSVGFIAVFPLTFISSAFVPGRLDARRRCSQFAEVNPFTIVVDAMRSLWLGAPAGNNVWGAVVWSFVIVAVFAPLAVARYRRVGR